MPPSSRPLGVPCSQGFSNLWGTRAEGNKIICFQIMIVECRLSPRWSAALVPHPGAWQWGLRADLGVELTVSVWFVCATEGCYEIQAGRQEATRVLESLP